MDLWTAVRFLHIAGVAFFVGGQLVLVIAVVPALRGSRDAAPMRRVARRFGVASAVALVVLLTTGIAMAGRLELWRERVLQLKVLVLVLVGVLLGLHVMSPRSRVVAGAVLACSLLLVWLGVELTHGSS